MHPNNPHGKPQMGQGGGYMPQQGQPAPQQQGSTLASLMGQTPQQQAQMGYYPPGQGQPGPQGGQGMHMRPGVQQGYAQGGAGMQQQSTGQHPSMMQQAMFGQQSAMGTGRGGGPMAGYPGQQPAGYAAGGGQQQYAQQAGMQGGQQQPGQPGAAAQMYQQQMQQQHGAGQQSGGAHGAQPHSGQPAGGQTGAQPHRTEPKKQPTQHPYSAEILNKLDKYSVGALCIIGKELVHELNLRTSALCNILKAISERKPHPQDVDSLMEYCLHLFDKLAEIRIRIERRTKGKELDVNAAIEKMTDMTDPTDERPAPLKEKYRQFDENRTRLLALNNDLKLLDWMATVSDPGQLKKVDKMNTSNKDV